ncbi:MAG: hypothetical protein ACLQBL_41075 [Polyangiaceae bacterium]
MGSRGALGCLFVLLFGFGTAAACSDSEPPDVPTYGPPGALGSQSPDPPSGVTSSSSGSSSGTASSSGSGSGSSSGSGSGGTVTTFACETGGVTIVDGGPCTVSWSTTIYPAIQGAWGCSAAAPCHTTEPPVMTGSASAVYASLANYTSASLLGNNNPYINPCSTAPAESNFVCNTQATGTTGLCGTSMPLVGGPLTAAATTEIATWVACGAPQN